jgi:hypothetical protein
MMDELLLMNKEDRVRLEEINYRLSSVRPRTTAEKKKLIHIDDPHAYDILMGQLGNAVATRPGNLALRQICWLYKKHHTDTNTSTKELAMTDSRVLARQVISHIKQMNPNVRFLVKTKTGNNGRCKWKDCGQDDMLEKARLLLYRKDITKYPVETKSSSLSPSSAQSPTTVQATKKRAAPEHKRDNVRAAPIAMPTILYNVLKRPLNENDVVFVGAKAADHPANKTFHQLVANNASDFDKAPWYVFLCVSYSCFCILISHTRSVLGRTSFLLPIELWIK